MSLEGERLRAAFWEDDRINNEGKLFSAYTETYNTICNRNNETEKLIANKLKKLLNHAVSTTEYYAKIIGDEYELSDFPVINKQTVIQNRERMTSCVFKGQKLHEMRTSGSTGIPFVIQQNKEKRLRVIAEIKATNDIAGYPSHEKMMYILGARRGVKPYSLEQQQRENIWRIPVAVNDDETMQILVDFLLNEHPMAIYASASSLPPLIDYIKKLGIASNQFTVTTIITGGEMVPPQLRIDLKDVFGEKCQIYVKYSNEEMGILAIDAGLDTPYLLNVANYYFEVLKMDSDEPCEMGELGRLVITDLYNYAVPLIRYDTGDIGALEEIPGKWPVLKSLNGKRRDLIFSTQGYSISGATITNILKNTRNVKCYQLIQEDEKRYRYKIVPGEQTPTSEDILLVDLYELLGNDAEIIVEFTDDVPVTNSQKRRYTVNLYRPQ